MITLKLWDIETQAYFDYVASGTIQTNGKVAQDVQLLDVEGSPIYLTMDAQGNVGVNVNGVTFDGNVTVNNIQLLDALNGVISPASKENQLSIINSLSNMIAAIQGNLNVSQNQEISTFYESHSETVVAGSYREVVITPDEGVIASINTTYISVQPPSGAGSGTHFLSLYVGSGSAYKRSLLVTGAYNVGLQIAGLAVTSGTPVPLDESAVALSLSNIKFNHDNPLTIRYTNNTNVTQTLSRIYEVISLEENSGSG